MLLSLASQMSGVAGWLNTGHTGGHGKPSLFWLFVCLFSMFKLHFQSPFFFFHLDCWSVRVAVNKTLFCTVSRCACVYVYWGAIGVVARVCVAVRVKPTARLRNATSGCSGPQTTWTVLLACPHVDNHVYLHWTAIDSYLAVFVFLASQPGNCLNTWNQVRGRQDLWGWGRVGRVTACLHTARCWSAVECSTLGWVTVYFVNCWNVWPRPRTKLVTLTTIIVQLTQPVDALTPAFLRRLSIGWRVTCYETII